MKKETVASILKVLIALVLIAALIFVIIYQNRDAQIGGEINIFKGDGDSRGIEGYSLGQTMPLGDKALLVTTNTLLLLDRQGRGEAKEISFSSPAIDLSGKYVAVYDRGGRSFALYKNDSLVYSLRAEARIVSAITNENGYTAIACQAEVGETRITVYNDKGIAFYSWNLGSGQFLAMDLSADNTHLAVSSLNDDRERMLGEISIIQLDKEERQAVCSRENEMYFDLHINRDSTVRALGSEQLDYYNADGTLRWSLPYNGRTLRSADISDSEMAVLCYAAADSGFVGNSTEVELINRLGEITASTSFDGLCESLSVNNDKFAVSAGKKIYIYNKKCELLRELSSNSAVKRMSLFKDGKTVFALSGSGGSIISE